MRRGAIRLACYLVAGTCLGWTHPGVGIVMDSGGSVYYTDLKQVWRIAPDGTKSVAVANVHTHELCLDAAGNLYGEHLWYEGEATDRWGHRVWRLSPDGTLSDVFPARQGFLTDYHYSFVRDRAGSMYWAERGEQTRIRRRTANGAVETVASARFRNVRWMTVTAEGTVYLMDLHDLVRVTPDGQVQTVVRQLTPRTLRQVLWPDIHAVMGLTTDGQGNVYAADSAGRAVRKVTRAGTVSTVARSRPPWSPTGVLVAPSGELWVLESSLVNRVRVRRIGRDGSEKVY